jgi:hypothetical protein
LENYNMKNGYANTLKKTTENTTMKQQKGKKKNPQFVSNGFKKTDVQTFVTRSMRLTRNLEST